MAQLRKVLDPTNVLVQSDDQSTSETHYLYTDPNGYLVALTPEQVQQVEKRDTQPVE